MKAAVSNINKMIGIKGLGMQVKSLRLLGNDRTTYAYIKVYLIIKNFCYQLPDA